MKKQLARNLRKNQTEAEKLLWYKLRDRRLDGWKFRRQHVLGPFIVDLVCLEKKLVIEVDGGQHFQTARQDAQRTNYLDHLGFTVLRFWNTEVLGETEAVLDVILNKLRENTPPQPNPLPQGGEGIKR